RKSADAVVLRDPAGGVHKIEMPGHGLVVRTMSNRSCEVSQFDAEGRCVGKVASLRRAAKVWKRAYWYSGEGDLLRAEDSLRRSAGGGGAGTPTRATACPSPPPRGGRPSSSSTTRRAPCSASRGGSASPCGRATACTRPTATSSSTTSATTSVRDRGRPAPGA